MDTLRPDQVRQRIAATLEGLALATGSQGTLREAPCDYNELPQGVPNQRQHLAFAVANVRTTEVPDQRQRQGRPLRVESSVSVRHALAAEAEVIVAALGVSGANALQVTYNATPSRQPIAQTPDAPGAVLSQLDFTAIHYIATT